ncbi:MAG TPA: MG2 domain-containing protein, partial [Chitinophagales bacterium]|nr:MG2 domain-containing protein [Chitinophagales bacterium]
MRIAKLSLVALAMLLLASCNKNKVNLIETNAKDEVPSLGNLTFTFDKNLVGDSLLNQWDTTEYIDFSPPIAGRFRWENANELVFSPESDLPPATTFKAEVTSKVLQYNKKYSLGKCADMSFHTPYLQVLYANAMWNVNDGNAGNAFPQIDIFFNYKVDPAKLKDLLEVELEGSKANISIQTSTVDSKISVTLLGVKLEDKDMNAKLTIAKGLLPDRGTVPTDKVIETKLVITSPYNVSVQNTESDHDGTQGTVKVFMSQAPVSENINSFISFDPKVNFKVETSSDGMVITSEEFDVAKSYTMTLKTGLKGRIGGTLKDDYSATIAFGQLEPQITIVNKKGVYLSPKGSKNIEVRISSIKKVKISISKIYENNLLAAQRYGYYTNDYEGEYYEGDGDYYGSDAVMGDVIYEKEIETKTLPRYGNSRLFKFNIEDKLKDMKGIYHIKIQSTEDYWRSEARFISLSDIGLIAKESKDKIFVFANSITSAESLSGVNVTVFGKNNQAVGSGTTDANGVAAIDLKKRDFSGFKAAMITARNGNDFNYLPFNTTHVETSRFDVGGKRQNITGIDAFVYSERDIYRPGEKINFSVVSRDWKWNTPGEIPLKMKFLLPNGKELKTLKKTLNDQGSLETQIELSPAAVTGSYTLEVYTSNDILLTSKSVLIEEFMPDRIKVTAALDKKFLKPSETTTLSINAMNFFGPPAANRNYEVEIQFKQKYFSPDKYAKYSFTLSEAKTYYDNITREGTLDENGNAKETYTVPAEYKNQGLMEADFFTTVFDETGRPVNRRSAIDIFTQDIFYGLRADGYYYCPLNQPVNFPLIALNKDEKPIATRAHVQVIKHEYRTVLSKNYEYFRYESQREDKTIIDQEVSVTGENTVFNFVPRTPGDYEIRVGMPGVNTFVRRSFYSYGSWGSSGGNFEVNNEGNIDIETDKGSYLCGESAKVLFKTPFNGKMLVTLENDRVLEHQYVTVTNRSATVTFSLKTEDLPNAYITATLIKPHEESDMPLTVAHGFKSVTVEETSRKIPVQIFAEKNVRSRTHQKVRVKGAPNCKITLAAVDEGILQITNYQTPDPYSFFYSKRALEVNSFDLYPLLFPELKGTLSSTGGDGFDLSKRTNPLQNKRVKLVSYWSGITDANGNGEANFEFDIPQFSGQLRLMAVAYKDACFGSGEMNMTVADPVVISTALPRFLSPSDTVIMPVTISNTTKNSTSATATVKITGPVKVVGSTSQQVSLKANAEGRAVFKIVADAKIDVAKISVEVSALNEKFLEETDITVRPAVSLQKITDAGAIAGGSSKSINFAVDKFIASSADYQLILSKNPTVELADQMYNLVNYPHGCTEQTVSAAFPQLYFSDLADLMKADKKIKANANYNVQEAIRKIKMRQLYNGAITLWDHEGSENWWASVYAAHFLQEAQKAGFEVDKSLLDNLYQYLSNRLKNKESITYYYNGNLKKQIAPKEVAYSLYVLALAGKAQVSTMNYYKQNTDMLALDSKYLLSAAYAIAGDKGKFKEMLPGSFTGEVANKETGGSFYSDLRDEAIALNAVLEVDPNNPQIGTMAKHVSQMLKTRYYLSTQERAFGFLALGKIGRQANNTSITASIKVNGKEIAKNDGSTLKLTSKQLGGTNVE